MEPRQLDQIKKEVTAVVYAFFETGKNKDLASIPNFHSPQALFTKFDDSPPYTRQNSEEAFIYEQAEFANISDYEYDIQDMRVDAVDGTAIATFYLSYRGVFVNDYSFEGRGVGSKLRVTMVFAKFDGEWKIVHEHFSAFPDLLGKIG